MLTPRTKAHRRRWFVAFALLAIFEGGCASLVKPDRSDRGVGSGTTIGTDPATVKPGQTIAPPSLGVDLTRWSVGRKFFEGDNYEA